MKKLLSFIILFISHGLLGMDGTREVRETDNGKITCFKKNKFEGYELDGFKYNNNTRKIIPEGVETVHQVRVDQTHHNTTFYAFSSDPEKETLVKVSDKELRTTHALVSFIEASNEVIDGKTHYSASEVGHNIVKNWGGTNNNETEPVAHERFELLKSIFKSKKLEKTKE